MGIGDEEENIWRAIAAIDRARSQEAGIKSVEDAVEMLRQELQCEIYPRGKSALKPDTQLSRRKAVRSIIGPTPKVEACIQWLGRTGQFKDLEIRRLRRINFFVEDLAGQITVNQNTISLNTASILLCMLCLLSGLWIGWIIFGSKGDLQEIANSFALGTIGGATASLILDRSFRFEEMKTKVASSAPWLFR